MTESCRKNGCRMFGPGTSERAACKRACHDERPAPTKSPSKGSVRLALLLAAVSGFSR